MNCSEALRDAGVSIWLDTLSRELLDTGRFAELVRRCAVTGATSNPAIFARAVTGSDRYDEQLRGLAADGMHDARDLFFAVALDDVRRAAAILRPAYERSRGQDGYVSFQCTPDIADDAAAMVGQALDLSTRLDLPNVLIKVPATPAGITALEELTARGVNVNVTLLFSVERYDDVVDAYLRGLERRVAAGRPVSSIVSFASFFVSRLDAKADALLPPGSPLRGRIALANAHRAYLRYRARFHGPRWDALAGAGARPQRPVWASTGTKDPGYSDVLYVERLIAPGVVNTMPEQTLHAFAAHGSVEVHGDPDPHAALEELAAAGVDLEALTDELEREGIDGFRGAYDRLLTAVERWAAGSVGASTWGGTERVTRVRARPRGATRRGCSAAT